MSFSFRNLFSQDEGGANSGDRTGGPGSASNVRTQEYEVGELLPFIPPAIVAQSGIPINKNVQVPMPADGSCDVRLSTIYQTCPALFAAEITPLNDSTISLPPLADASEVGEEKISFNSNPFADAAPGPGFGFPQKAEGAQAAVLQENRSKTFGSVGGESDPNNPFGDAGSPKAEEPEQPAPFSSALQENSFGGSPETPQGNPFADADSFDEIIKSPSGETNSDFPPNPPADPPEKPDASPGKPKEEAPFGSSEVSFSSLFSKKADEDKELPTKGASPIGNLFKEATGAYVGPPEFNDDEADLNSEDGFEAFIPPGMEISDEYYKPEATPEEAFQVPVVFSDDASDPVETSSTPAAPPVNFTENPAEDARAPQQGSPFEFSPQDESPKPTGNEFGGLFGGSPGKTSSESSQFQALTDAEQPPAAEKQPDTDQPVNHQSALELAAAEVAATEKAIAEAAAEKAAAEKAAAERAAAERAAAEKAAAERAAAEKAAAEEAAAERAAAEKAAAERAAAERAAAEKAAAEKAAAEKAAAERAAAEEAAAEKAAAGKAAAEKAAAEKAAAEKAAAERAAAERAAAEKAAAEKAAAGKAAAEREENRKEESALNIESDRQSQPAAEELKSAQIPAQANIKPSRTDKKQSIVVHPPVNQEEPHEPETKEVSIPRKDGKASVTGPVNEEMRDIELRAIFSTDENFTLRKVSQKVAAIDGILACAVVTPDRVIEAYADQAYAIGDKVQVMAEHARGLSVMGGDEGASYFTIHMGQSYMSFFFGETNLLGVKHQSDAFKPGVREKLILVARSLDSLKN